MIKLFLSLFCRNRPWGGIYQKCFASSKTSHYDTLEVDSTASQSEIKNAYYRLSKKYHPDRNPGASERFRSISEAYEILSDTGLREDYDLSRSKEAAKAAKSSQSTPQKQSTTTTRVSNEDYARMWRERVSSEQASMGSSSSFSSFTSPYTETYRPKYDFSVKFGHKSKRNSYEKPGNPTHGYSSETNVNLNSWNSVIIVPITIIFYGLVLILEGFEGDRTIPYLKEPTKKE